MWLTKSSVGRKVIMSVSGAALIFFLLFLQTFCLFYVHVKNSLFVYIIYRLD